MLLLLRRIAEHTTTTTVVLWAPVFTGEAEPTLGLVATPLPLVFWGAVAATAWEHRRAERIAAARMAADLREEVTTIRRR